MTELLAAARDRARTDSPTHTLIRDLADEVERLRAWNEMAHILLENVRVQGERADKYLDRICGSSGSDG